MLAKHRLIRTYVINDKSNVPFNNVTILNTFLTPFLSNKKGKRNKFNLIEERKNKLEDFIRQIVFRLFRIQFIEILRKDQARLDRNQ